MGNRLKSIFIGIYPVVAVMITLASLLALASDITQLVWWGALLTGAPLSLLFVRLLILKDVARTSKSLPLLASLALVGMALALYSWAERGETESGLLATAIGFAGFVLYDFWYSNLGRSPSDQIMAGAPLPDFVVQDPEGKEIPSASLTDQPALILFYRGNWCPLCMAQLDELAVQHRDFEDLDVQVILISPQPHEFTAKLAARHDVNFRFLVDPGGAAARKLKIIARNGLPIGLGILGYAADTVLPTVIITDNAGRVIFADQTNNYRVRPEPETFLKICREAQLAS